MNYAQAVEYINRKYGGSPWNVVSGLDLLRDLRAAGASSDVSSQINLAYYTAKRLGNATIGGVLESKGLLTPGAINTPVAPTPVPVPTATAAPAPTPTYEPPTISVADIFNQPAATPTPAPTPQPVSIVSVPSLPTPSLLASQESGAIGAASIASQMPTTTTSVAPTITIRRTDREVIQDGKRYDVMSDGSLRLSTDQTNIPAPTTASIPDERDRIRASLGLPPLTPTTPIQVPSTATTPSVPTIPVITVPKLTEVATEVPVIQNPLPGASAPAGTVPVIQVPAMSVPTAAPIAPAMGGSLEDQINYQSAIRRLTQQLGLSKESAKQQAGELRAQYEPQIRRAARERYNAQIKALASLGARGIAGAPGLSVAARRAGGAEADYRRLGLIGERERQLSALNRTLTQQTADYEEELRRNQEQLTRATTLANQLTGVK